MNKFGFKIRELRESKGLLLRQIAAYLESDTAFISKLERGERKAKRKQVISLASYFEVPVNDLLTLWLSDQIYDLVNNEEVAVESLYNTLETIKNK